MLERVGVFALVQAVYDDVTSLDEAHRLAAPDSERPVEQFGHPGTRRVDKGTRVHDVRCAGRRAMDVGAPLAAVSRRAHQAVTDPNVGAAQGSILRVQDDEPAVIDRAIGVGKAGLEACPQRRAVRRRRKADVFGGFERAAPAQPVVKEESEADRPGWPQPVPVGQHEPLAPDEVRCDREEMLALHQRLANQAQVQILEVAQAAMHQLGGRGRRVIREAVLFDEHDAKAAARGVARNAGAVDSAADDEQVEVGVRAVHDGRCIFSVAFAPGVRNHGCV